jgi:hypothetical protein
VVYGTKLCSARCKTSEMLMSEPFIPSVQSLEASGGPQKGTWAQTRANRRAMHVLQVSPPLPPPPPPPFPSAVHPSKSLRLNDASQPHRATPHPRYPSQTCEVALRLFLARAHRFAAAARRRRAQEGGPGTQPEMQQNPLVFDCSGLLSLHPSNGMGGWSSGVAGLGLQREHRVPVEPLVHFFCRCVELLCGGAALLAHPS